MANVAGEPVNEIIVQRGGRRDPGVPDPSQDWSVPGKETITHR